MGAQSTKPAPNAPERSKEEHKMPATSARDDDDEPDEWDKRIYSTGCSEENARMTDCYFEKKDWRACVAEMDDFKKCWKMHGNDQRTSSKDA